MRPRGSGVSKERRCKTPRLESVATNERPPLPSTLVQWIVREMARVLWELRITHRAGKVWDARRLVTATGPLGTVQVRWQWHGDHRAGQAWDAWNVTTALWRWWRRTWAGKAWSHHLQGWMSCAEERVRTHCALPTTAGEIILHHAVTRNTLRWSSTSRTHAHADVWACYCLPPWETALFESPLPSPLRAETEGTRSG